MHPHLVRSFLMRHRTHLFPLAALLSCPTVARSFSPLPGSVIRPLAPHTTTITTASDSDTCQESTATSTYLKMSNTEAEEEDPYLWLEEVESEESLNFAKDANDKCLTELGDPTGGPTYDRILAVLESKDRIPFATKFGIDENGNEILVNYWRDAKNPKGIWRKTTFDDYKKAEPNWTTLLDVDKLAEKDGISWVWKGSRPLPRSRDPLSNGGKRITRALLNLSRGGSDAVVVKEFDFLAGDFVPESEQPFYLPEAKSRASYKSRDVLLVGTDFGKDSLTDSGYPRTVREWVRGTKLEDSPIVFEGEKTDVSVSAYCDDQRARNNGPIYEVRARAITFYTTKRWARMIQGEHLLAPDDPARKNAPEPPEFTEVLVQEDASIDFVGNFMMIELRSDWQPIADGKKYIKGSILYVEAKTFLEQGPTACEYKVLFEPSERTASEYYSVTKNYLIHIILDNVKPKVEFFKIGENELVRVGNGDMDPQIMDISMGPIDAYEDDRVWLTTSSYLQPSTLSLADASLVEDSSRDCAADGPNALIIEKIKSLPDQYDSSNLDILQGSATSKDGTSIPYFLVKAKDTKLDGKNPTLLYGYGGFEISLGPHYAATAGIAWLERGGVYVEANIRGGGEFGAKWHQAALKENRNKSYEDFIAVAEDLIASGYCQPSTLGIRGGSNGGLLVGNMYTMRPDLFGAIHCAVPLLDMKRYNLLLAGAS